MDSGVWLAVPASSLALLSATACAANEASTAADRIEMPAFIS
jgi:hypothetical protein